MRIRGVDNWSPDAVEAALAAGGRLVLFEYCISLVFITLRRPTGPYLVWGSGSRVWRGLPFTLVSLLLGWWGLPWGVIYTPLTIITNLSGGRDVTAEVRAYLRQSSVPVP